VCTFGGRTSESLLKNQDIATSREPVKISGKVIWVVPLCDAVGEINRQAVSREVACFVVTIAPLREAILQSNAIPFTQ